MEAFAGLKQAQKEGWANFAPLATITTPAAARLVRHAAVRSEARVLDVGCGTGVVAVTAARLGARVTGIDLTSPLLEHARENSRLAEVDIDWREGDVEELPFPEAQFDIVLSQFAHIFAPRPDVALAQMIRVLKPGGTIAFSTWPPELLIGRTMALTARYVPPPPAGLVSPALWGDPNEILQRLGNAVADIVFDRDSLSVSALSPQHFRVNVERSAGSIVKLIDLLSRSSPEQLQTFRQEFDAIVAAYFRDNIVRQDYLLTRAKKL